MRGARIDIERAAMDIQAELLAHLHGELRRVFGDHPALGRIHRRAAGRTQLERVPVQIERTLPAELFKAQRADKTERTDEVGPDIDAHGGNRGSGHWSHSENALRAER